MDRADERWLASTRSTRGHSKPRTNFGKRGRTVSRQLWGRSKPHGYARLNPYSMQFQGLHWSIPQVNFSKWITTGQGKVLLLLAIMIAGIFAVDQGLRVSGVHPDDRPSVIDPNTIIWRETAPNNDLGTFKTLLATFCANPCGSVGGKALQLSPNATHTAVALSKNPIGDLSVANAKNLQLVFSYLIGVGVNQNKQWGVYLTTNGTLPTNPNYSPSADQSVYFLSQSSYSAPNFNAYTYFLRNIGGGSSETIGSEDVGNCGGTGSCFLSSTDSANSNTNYDYWNFLNFTGTTGTSPCSGTTGYGNGCSFFRNQRFGINNAIGSTTLLPFTKLQAQQFYIGFFALAGLGVSAYWSMSNPAMSIEVFNGFAVTPIPAPTPSAPPNIDTGGFFGPIIQALIGIGVFIAKSIISFFAYLFSLLAGVWAAVQPFLNSILGILSKALSTFEQFAAYIMNTIGSAFGFPSTSVNCGVAGGTCALGDLVFLWVGNLITFLAGTFNTLLAQLGAIFTGIFNAFLVFVQWITQAFSWLSSMLTFAGNIAVFAFGIFTTALKFTTIFIPFWIFVFFLGFNADEGVPGWIQWYGFVKWVTFDLGVKWTLEVLNFSVDIVLFLVGLIPKPFIQMSIGKIPRLPILNIHGSFSWPSFNGQALKEGNLFSVLGMLGGFIGFVWYELSQTGIPGSLAAEYPTASFVTNASTAITFYKLFLPMAVLVVFLLMIPTLFTSIFGVRVEGLRGVPVNVRTGSFRTRTFATSSQGPIFRSSKYATDARGRAVIDSKTGEKVLLRRVDRFLAKGARRQENIRFNESQERKENTLLSKRLDEEARKVAQEEKTRRQEEEKQKADTARDLEEQAE